MFAAATSCKDDSIELIPEWETGVHGLAEITSANTDFLYVDPTAPVDIDLQWISIDSKNTVTRIEVFILFNENYTDVDGNPAVAAHGGATGRSFQVFEGSAVPANRQPLSLSISQAAVYALYQDATFNYGNGSVSVFTNPANPNRDATNRFMWDDDLRVRWEFTTDDGRVFEKWGVSVCTEFPGANCQVDFGVVCATDPPNPVGTWTFNLTDTYGDGWQGGYLGVVVDGAEVAQIRIPNGGGSSGLETYTVAPGASLLEFVWHLDTWQSEVEFTITSPSGNVVADVAAPPAGKLKLNLCLE